MIWKNLVFLFPSLVHLALDFGLQKISSIGSDLPNPGPQSSFSHCSLGLPHSLNLDPMFMPLYFYELK